MMMIYRRNQYDLMLFQIFECGTDETIDYCFWPPNISLPNLSPASPYREGTYFPASY